VHGAIPAVGLCSDQDPVDAPAVDTNGLGSPMGDAIEGLAHTTKGVMKHQVSQG
jgi:hypothetical protein